MSVEITIPRDVDPRPFLTAAADGRRFSYRQVGNVRAGGRVTGHRLAVDGIPEARLRDAVASRDFVADQRAQICAGIDDQAASRLGARQVLLVAVLALAADATPGERAALAALTRWVRAVRASAKAAKAAVRAAPTARAAAAAAVVDWPAPPADPDEV